MKNIKIFILCLCPAIFAQEYQTPRSELSALLFSSVEIQTVAEYIKGDTYVGEGMDKEEFLRKIVDYDIIHLATHTIIDKSQSRNSRFYITNNSNISDEEAAVFASDILPLNLSAKMVTLSSCNTGIGELIPGEGIMSLARAFKYAGCPSVIMTLWEIDDISTSQIIDSFYYGLKTGLKKDEALRKAKLEYLSNSNSKNSSPKYWAAAAPIGKMDKLIFKNSIFSLKNILLLILVLAALLFVFLLQNRTNFLKSRRS